VREPQAIVSKLRCFFVLSKEYDQRLLIAIVSKGSCAHFTRKTTRIDITWNASVIRLVEYSDRYNTTFVVHSHLSEKWETESLNYIYWDWFILFDFQTNLVSFKRVKNFEN
jgi:hypothetical protein